MWNPLMLLQGVRAVSALANPAEPLTVTQRAFDAKRAKSQKYARLPAARQIAEQLQLPWPEVLAVAHEPEERQNLLLALKKPEENADWLTDEGVRTELRGVALSLGQETVTESDYRVKRATIVAADRRRWRNGGLLRMPSHFQIRRKAGSWDAALRMAGLKTAQELGHKHSSQSVRPSLVELIQRFYEAHGLQPTEADLRVYASTGGIPYASSERFGAAMREWKQARLITGLPVPSAPPPRDKRPDYSVTPPGSAAKPGEKRKKHKKWSKDECAAWAQRCLEESSGGSKGVSENDYNDWRKQHPNAPSLKPFQQYGGWPGVRKLAQDRIQAGLPPA